MANKGTIDLDALSLQELTDLIAEAEAKRSEKMEGARAALVAEMKEKAAALGMTLDALYTPAKPSPAPATRKPRKPFTPATVQFRGPQGQEWSGRGRPPAWIATAEAEGKSRDQFRV